MEKAIEEVISENSRLVIKLYQNTNGLGKKN